jgi:multidrug efflux system membrane fusion protein
MEMIRRIALALFIPAVAVAGCGDEGGKNAGEVKKVNVRTSEVSKMDVTLPVSTSGVLSSGSEQKLSFKTGGIIQSIHVDEGETVEGGALLASLNLAEIRAVFRQAESAWRKVQRDLERMKNLYGDSVVTLEQYQNAQTSVEVARSAMEIARFNLDHSTITAPSNGKVLKRFAEESEMVGPGTPVFLFGETLDGWKVKVGVIDRDLIRIGKGDSASVRFDAWPGYDFPAVVEEISGFADPMTGTFEVDLNLDPRGRTLASGFSARAKIFPSDRILSLVVPIESVIEADRERGFVFIVSANGETARKVPVELDLLFGDDVAVRGPLEEGMMVVTDGAPYLMDGSRTTSSQRS